MIDRLDLTPHDSTGPLSVPALQWSRMFAQFGRYDAGSFIYSASDPTTPRSAHNSWLLADIREGNTWRGFVNSVTLVYPPSVANEAYMYSLAPSGAFPFHNSVATTNESDAITPGFTTDTTSADRYGLHELVYPAEGDLATLTSLRDSLLLERSVPRLQPVSIPARVEKLSVHVDVLGYLYTSLWIAALSSPPANTVSDWITYWIGLCPFLNIGEIASNTRVIDQPDSAVVFRNKSCYHGFVEMLQYRDHNNNKMRLWVDIDNNVHYQPVDTAVRLFMRGGVYHDAQSGHAAKPADLRSGVIENKDTGTSILYESIGFTTSADGTRRIVTNLDQSAIATLIQ